MTCKLLAGDKVLSSRSTTRSAAASSSGRATRRRRRTRRSIPFATMKELRAARREQQALDRQGHAGQRDVDLRQERGGGQCLPRQDHQRDGRDGEVGPVDARTTCCPARSSCTARRRPSTSAPWTTSIESGPRHRRRCRHSRWRHPKRTGAATSSSRRRPAVPPASCRRSSMRLVESERKLPQEKIREGMLAAAAIGYLCKHNATLSAAEGGCQAEIGVASSMAAALIATALRRAAAGGRERRRIGAGASPGHDLRPGRRLRAGSVHRALRLRRGQGLDRLRDRQQRDRVPAPRRFRRDHQGPGPDRART